MAGPREIFTDVNAFLACTKNVCEFCTKKEQSNERHLRRKHLQKAVYFFHQQKECFTVACHCKLGQKTTTRVHYHCPFCNFKPVVREDVFKVHLPKVHDIT
ncbi:unnamed protein product [Knipowitschia caucasica]